MLKYKAAMKKSYVGFDSKTVLKEVFGYKEFRSIQKEIIQNVLDGKDTVAIMPTGGGKSLCYQIPALIFDGITVVISPLISLMQDQVSSLQNLGINAVFLNSSVEWKTYLSYMNSVRDGETKIVYVSPEGFASKKIQELLHDERVKVSCITIDEAHCISSWGHDFRPDYLEIRPVIKQFPGAVCLALTATATKEVQKDIIKSLGLKKPEVLTAGFNRPNIFLNVMPRSDGFLQVVECIRRHKNESGIIYCFSRRQVDLLAEQLVRSGYSALNYHAGLSDSERKQNQDYFLEGRVQIMVATLAFGMGINKSDVRFVIHYELPRSIEQYYQEIGRAGRDGKPSEALLLYSGSDLFKIRHFFEDSFDRKNSERLLQAMVDFVRSDTCRRQKLLSYFGEEYDPDAHSEDELPCCDCCERGPVPKTDMTICAQKLLSCIIRTESRYGISYITEVLLGMRAKRIVQNHHDKLSTWGIGKELDKNQWSRLAAYLVDNGYLLKSEKYGVLSLTKKGLDFLRNRDLLFIPFVL